MSLSLAEASSAKASLKTVCARLRERVSEDGGLWRVIDALGSGVREPGRLVDIQMESCSAGAVDAGKRVARYHRLRGLAERRRASYSTWQRTCLERHVQCQGALALGCLARGFASLQIVEGLNCVIVEQLKLLRIL